MGQDQTISVVKIGGSLAADSRRLRSVLRQIAQSSDGKAVIVAGGGPFADAVRQTQRDLSFSDGFAHRLALGAMGAMAEIFAALEPGLSVSRNVDEIRSAHARDRVPVWDPVDLRVGHPEIPETWDVTSDSLALWLARSLGATRCVFYKSAPCPAWNEADELVRLGLVDAAFADFAKAYAGAIVIRGSKCEDAVAA